MNGAAPSGRPFLCQFNCQYFTLLRNNACPGTDSPASPLVPVSMSSFTQAGSCFPRPTSINVPTMALTMFLKNLSALTLKNQYGLWSQEEGVLSETCGHPRPHKREGPKLVWEGSSETTVSERTPSSGGKPKSIKETCVGTYGFQKASVMVQMEVLLAPPTFSKQEKSCFPRRY